MWRERHSTESPYFSLTILQKSISHIASRVLLINVNQSRSFPCLQCSKRFPRHLEKSRFLATPYKFHLASLQPASLLLPPTTFPPDSPCCSHLGSPFGTQGIFYRKVFSLHLIETSFNHRAYLVLRGTCHQLTLSGYAFIISQNVSSMRAVPCPVLCSTPGTWNNSWTIVGTG